MKKAKYKVGDTLYWYSIIEGKVVGGRVKAITGDEYAINVNGILWAVEEFRLSKRKSVEYKGNKKIKVVI